MKHNASFLLAPGALLCLTVQVFAQFQPVVGDGRTRANLTSNVYDRSPGYNVVNPGYYGGYGPTYNIPDPYNGYLTGVASLTQAQGQYQKDYQAARLSNQQVEQEKIKTRRQAQDQRAYEYANRLTAQDLQEQKKQLALRRALNDPPLPEILNADAPNALLENMFKLHNSGVYGPRIDLDPEVLKQINVNAGQGGNMGVFKDGARLPWPIAFRDTPYEKDVEHFQELLTQALKDAQGTFVKAGTIRDMQDTIERLSAEIRRHTSDLPTDQSIEAKRFLHELDEGVRALRDPKAANYFTNKWTAKGKTVGDLVENMKREGLKFAPAVAGQETAYRVLHQAMVSYDINAASMAQAKAPPMPR